jgi:putative sterol carrier protein
MATFPNNISVKELLMDFSPKMVRETISARTAELAGLKFSMVIEVSGDKFSYVVKDGTAIDVKENDLSNPMVRIQISKEDIEKMIATQNLDMLLGLLSDLTKDKHATMKKMKGSFTALLANDDSSKYTIKAIFNDAQTPHATFKMKTSDSSALVRKETNPTNLFMTGSMKIEGDMGFAMTTQPLFT